MLNHQSIRKAIVLSSLLCALSLSLPISTIAAPKELTLDSRITQSSSFSQLAPLENWEQPATKRTDYQEQWRGCASGISNIPGGWETYRASNLAASKHYAEAIEELTKAIACYDTPQTYELAPEWLLRRAKLLRLVGLDKQALADIKRALNLKRCYDTAKFQGAKVLIEYGEYADAESVLKPLTESGASIFRSYNYYLLAIAQEKQGKTDSAIKSYKQAATLFTSAGMSPPALACLDAITALSSKTPGEKPLSIADLTPPKSNVDKIEKLIKALTTQADIFDMDKLKELIGATTIKEINTGYFVSPYKGHFKELSLVTIDKRPSGGLLLRIHLDPILCTVDRSAFAPYAKDKVDAAQQLRKELGHSEGFKVPSGTIIFSMFDNGFKPIQYIELYSREAQYPQPSRQQASNPQANQPQSTRQQAGQPQATTKTDKHYYRILEHYWGRYDQLPQAEKLVQEWVTEEPESPWAHMSKAEVLASQAKYEEALQSIETAQKFKDRAEGLRNEYSGDVLIIKRGSYLLELGKFKEALADFKKGFPEQLTPEHFLLRGRAELGLQKYTEAANDLKTASEAFYKSCRIVKRDEVQKLLQSIPQSTLTGASAQATPPVMAQQQTEKENREFIEEQKRQAVMRMKAVEDKARNEQQEKDRQKKETIANALNQISEAKKQQDTRPDHYILSLLNMAWQCHRQNKTADEKKYIDQALDYYETYTPGEDYDNCTRGLISQLKTFKGQELNELRDRVIKRSELFCKTQSFREGRDRDIMDCTGYAEADRVTILEKLIKVREQMQSKSGASPASLYRQLSQIYDGKGDGKQAVWALEKAIEKSPTASQSAHYHTDLARHFLRNKELDSARKEWKKAGEAVNWKISSSIATSFTGLAKEFLQEGDRKTCKEILAKSLTNTDMWALKEIDDFLWEFIKNLESAREYADAEALLSKRIEAGKADAQDDSLSDWQIQLSELYLMSERPAESEKLYKQSRESALLRGDAVRGIDLRREKTLERAGIERKKEKNPSSEVPAKSITFPHVLYAFSELSLNGNTSTNSCDSRSSKKRQLRFSQKDGNGDICSPGKISIKGNTTVFGSIYGKLPKDAPLQISTWTKLGKTLVVPEAKMQPHSMIVDSSTGRTKLGNFRGNRKLAGGDYEATSLRALPLQSNLEKPARIFITDDDTTERYAVRLGSTDDGPPENLQIYYLGYRPIIFEHNSRISAVIYAPYSRVTMGDNNCSFRGAIVANKITTIGNVTATYDKALKDKVFTPSEPAVPTTEPEEQSEPEPKQALEEAKAKAQKCQEDRDKQKALFKSRLSKYPALLKLDLLEGPVIYRESEESLSNSSCGWVVDGREIDIQGTSSIRITEENDGSSTIILDGLRLMDKALIPFKKKDYKRAEEILVAALRAKPESEAFSMLAECWFLQKRYDEALQACQMALEIDTCNKSAQLLKERLIPKAKRNGQR